MMSSYFKEYIIKQFKRHSRDLFITLVLYSISMYFVSIRSEYATAIGTVLLFFLIFIKRFESKSLAQPQLNSRNIELLILPLTSKEMFYAQFIALAIAILPIYVVLMGITATIYFNETKISLLQFVGYESMAVFLLFLISTIASLRMNFVKLKRIHKLTSVTRFLNYIFVLVGVALVGVAVNKFYKTNVLALIIYFLALIICVVYLSFNVEKKYLNEHKIYKNKNFKWFDIPSAIIMLFVLGSVFFSLTQPTRNPSSISKEHISK